METRRVRRSTIRAKVACTLCRKRRIRCDGTRPMCTNCTRYKATSCSLGQTSQRDDEAVDDHAKKQPPTAVIPEWWGDYVGLWIEKYPGLSTSTSIPGSRSLLDANSTTEDLHLFYHLTFLTSELIKTEGHVFAFGTFLLPSIFEQAQLHTCARDALLLLSAHHIANITRLSSLRVTELACQARACKSLRATLDDFSEEAADAALVSSIVLAWTSNDSRAYNHFALGICALLEHVRESDSPSRVLTKCEMNGSLPTDDKRIMIEYLSLPESSLKQFIPLVNRLSLFKKRHRDDNGLDAAAEALLSFISNVNLELTQKGAVDEARALWEIKTWIPWVPKAVIDLGFHDLQTMVILAFFEATMIATSPHLPTLSKALFLPKRCEVIGRIWSDLTILREKCAANGTGTAEVDEAMDMVVVPFVYAVRYRAQPTTK